MKTAWHLTHRIRLAMEIGEFVLKLDQRTIGAGDVARAACPCTHADRGLDHRIDDLGVLPHA